MSLRSRFYLYIAKLVHTRSIYLYIYIGMTPRPHSARHRDLSCVGRLCSATAGLSIYIYCI